jgi:hypothetical protein
MSYLSSALRSAFNKVILGTKEIRKPILFPWLYVTLSFSWELFLRAREIFIGLTKAVKAASCWVFILKIQLPNYPLLPSPNPVCLVGIKMLCLWSVAQTSWEVGFPTAYSIGENEQQQQVRLRGWHWLPSCLHHRVHSLLSSLSVVGS